MRMEVFSFWACSWCCLISDFQGVAEGLEPGAVGEAFGLVLIAIEIENAQQSGCDQSQRKSFAIEVKKRYNS